MVVPRTYAVRPSDKILFFSLLTVKIMLNNRQILNVEVILEKGAEALTHCTVFDNSTAKKSK